MQRIVFAVRAAVAHLLLRIDRIIDRKDSAARIAENELYTFIFQSAGDHLATG